MRNTINPEKRNNIDVNSQRAIPDYAWVSAVATSCALTIPYRHARANSISLATIRAASGVSAAVQRAFASLHSRTDGFDCLPPLSNKCSAGGAKDVNGQGGTDTANWNSFEAGLTLVHVSAQLERYEFDRGCA